MRKILFLFFRLASTKLILGIVISKVNKYLSNNDKYLLGRLVLNGSMRDTGLLWLSGSTKGPYG